MIWEPKYTSLAAPTWKIKGIAKLAMFDELSERCVEIGWNAVIKVFEWNTTALN